MKKETKKVSNKFVVGNWKMNPSTVVQARKIFSEISKVPKKKGVSVIICPPAIFLSEISRGYRGSISFGVQNVHKEKEGAYTGEESVLMAKSLGAKYSIVGHSERRMSGETNADVSSKVNLILKSGLTPILCIGESDRDHDGEYLKRLSDQLLESLAELPKNSINKIIIAYEPIWAIGKKEAMSPRDLHETSIFIRRTLVDRFGKSAFNVPLLYGGSVDAENASSLVSEGEVDGLLIGRQSLVKKSMERIVTDISAL